jgi:hypothetical protein
MISPVTALLIYLTALLPKDIPANMIYLGPSIDPIHSIKIRRGHVADETYMLLTPINFIRIKSIIEGSQDLCTLAIDESIKKCMAGMQREQEMMLNRELSDQQIITAYETRLTAIESELKTSEQQNKVLLWTAGSLALLSSVALTLHIVR